MILIQLLENFLLVSNVFLKVVLTVQPVVVLKVHCGIAQHIYSGGL